MSADDGTNDEMAEHDDAVTAEELDAAFAEEQELAARAAAKESRPNVLLRLYRGQTSFDFIGNAKWWFGISSLIILIGLVSLFTRGLNEGIDFKGGQSWTVASQTLTVAQATKAAEAAGATSPTVVQLTNHLNGTRQIEVTVDLNSKSAAEKQVVETNVTNALAKAADTSVKNVNFSEVGPSWGSQVSKRAIEALIVFFIAVALYISARFEFKMAIAAIVAVVHDVLVVVGIYSLTGFQVTPDTVVAVLTVLGYSLYDTVVVFDRIRDNAQGLGASGRITYSEMVNLSMNQTLARSINTSLVAIIPVLSVLVVGSYVLGATSLENFGLALVIGLTSGAYSSIFIASPLLSIMKEREPRYIAIRQRLEARGERSGRATALTPAMAAAMTGAGGAKGRGAQAGGSTSGVLRPGAGQAARAAGTSVATTATPRPRSQRGSKGKPKGGKSKR